MTQSAHSKKITSITKTKSTPEELLDFDTTYPQLAQSLERIFPTLPAQRSIDNLNHLLDSENPAQTIENLSPVLLYRLITDTDWENGRELVPYMTPYQLQCCIDLDAWQGDLLNTYQLERWIDAVVDLASDEAFTELMRGVDSEIPALLFKHNIRAEVIVEDQDPFENEDVRWHLSPDNAYAIADISDENSAALMRKLIHRLYHLDRVLAWTLIESSIWEQTSEMQEFAYKWHVSRMEELGFPERIRALSVYTFHPPTETLKQWNKGSLPIKKYPSRPALSEIELYDKFPHRLFLFDAMEHLTSNAKFPHLISELISLQTHVIVAANVNPCNIGASETESKRAIGYLNIGLEFLSKKNIDEAILLLTTLPMRQIFSTGYSAASILKRQIIALEKHSNLSIIDGTPYSLLETREAELFRAIHKVRPETIDINNEPTPFLTLEEIEEASRVIRLVAFKQLWFFSNLAERPYSLKELCFSNKISNSAELLTFDLFFRTANANALIGEKDPFLPFDLQRIGILIQTIQKSPNLSKLKHSDAEEGSPFLPFFEEVAGSFPTEALQLASEWLSQTLTFLATELQFITDPSPDPDLLQTVLLVE